MSPPPIFRPCGFTQCSLTGFTSCGTCNAPPCLGCSNNTCDLIPDITITHTTTGGEHAKDAVSIQSTNGFNPSQNVTISRFLFSCAPTFLLKLDCPSFPSSHCNHPLF
ncbi:hypothetical protein HN51_032211 [Arachis hypogaea]